jgi:predicted SPOUT superfamily RNA methylase MTH1
LRQKLSIALPASIVSDTPHLREKTSKIGLVGRAAAIFRVDEIIVYPDFERTEQDREIDLISTLLRYMETPQYLRKKLFRIESKLRFAGILPPLRTLHHPLCQGTRRLEVGDYREAITLSLMSEGTLADIGVDLPGVIVGKKLQLGNRVTVRVKKADKNLELELASREEIPEYWGYTVTEENETLGRLLQNQRFDLKIATSKNGSPFIDVIDYIRGKWRSANSILIVFGAPSRGLKEIVREEGLSLLDLVDFVVNTVPEQGTETVRTEEAIVASLAAFNIFSVRS